MPWVLEYQRSRRSALFFLFISQYNTIQSPLNSCFLSVLTKKFCWLDARSGDIICCGCGIVKEAHSISPEAEYRVFQDDDGNSQNRIRVGPTYNPFLPHNFLGSKRKWERDVRLFSLSCNCISDTCNCLGKRIFVGGAKEHRWGVE